jgi:hypothetical protein
MAYINPDQGTPMPTLLRKPCASLAAAVFVMFFAVGLILTCLSYLHSAAITGVPFGGHTLQIGRDYVWANRIVVGFLILASLLFAHALARVVQSINRWRGC